MRVGGVDRVKLCCCGCIPRRLKQFGLALLRPCLSNQRRLEAATQPIRIDRIRSSRKPHRLLNQPDQQVLEVVSGYNESSEGEEEGDKVFSDCGHDARLP